MISPWGTWLGGSGVRCEVQPAVGTTGQHSRGPGARAGGVGSDELSAASRGEWAWEWGDKEWGAAGR